MLSSRRGVNAGRGQGAEEWRARNPSRKVAQERRQGFGVQEFLDGSKYEGDFVNGLKHGKGRYIWKSGEVDNAARWRQIAVMHSIDNRSGGSLDFDFASGGWLDRSILLKQVYEGSFYQDFRHGDGMYCWPTGNKFIGKFYLNWREGYGKHIFPDGATFKGLYHADQRFGPGVLSEPTGCQDVGLWHGKHLIQMCNSIQGSFSLKNLPEYAAHFEHTSVSHSQTQEPFLLNGLKTKDKTESETEKDDNSLQYDDNTILPDDIENYSTALFPLPPDIRREFDQHFYGQLWEPDSRLHEGNKHDPHSTLPLAAKMLAHIHKHRRQSETLDWDVAKVLSLKRHSFGPKGSLEVTSELLIQHASRGDRQAVLNILLDGLVHPDVADSQGHTALIGAVVNCHDALIHLLLDMGADIDKLNCEGLSALSVCHVLYYPFQPLDLLPGPQTQTQGLMSLREKTPQTRSPDFATDSSSQNNRPQTSDTVQTTWDLTSDQMPKESSGGIIFHRSSCSELSTVLNDHEAPAEDQQLKETDREEIVESDQERNRKGTRTETNARKNPVRPKQKDAESGEDNGQMKFRSLLKDEGRNKEDKNNQEEKGLFSERSIQVKDGHIVVGHVKWKECSSRSKKKERIKNRTPSQSMDSSSIQVSEKILQAAAEALSHTVVPRWHSDTQETVCKMAAMTFEHRVRLHTLNLLLDRGANPNASIVPFPVLFLAIVAADTKTVRRLLLCGAQTDICLSPERRGLYPLHVAAALTGPEGPKITELLLHALCDPDARACDQDEIYEPDQTVRKSRHTSEKPFPEEGGRTALHIACQRESDHCNASKVVSLLLSHRARTDLLWSGHSPLSLAIASGNEMSVEELLKGGADPNIPLGCGVGNALCAVTNFCYNLDGKRAKLYIGHPPKNLRSRSVLAMWWMSGYYICLALLSLRLPGDQSRLYHATQSQQHVQVSSGSPVTPVELDKLQKSGGDMLKPVQVGDTMGNVVDYAHHSFDQDLRIAHTPFHTLNMEQRETFKARRHLLGKMGSLLRATAVQREKEQQEREKKLLPNCESALSSAANSSHATKLPTAVKQRSPLFKFCYQCGRSAAMRLTACTRCHSVFYCSVTCKLKAWDERHREECLPESASPDSFKRMFLLQNQQDPIESSIVLKSIKIPTSSNAQFKSQIVGTEDVLKTQRVSLNENYSYN